jgi:hypothetical protein
MNVYFSPDNLARLKKLKSDGIVPNISFLVNELVTSYLRITGGEEE